MNKCKLCSHSWKSRDGLKIPKACPACKRYDWNKQNDNNSAKNRSKKGANKNNKDINSSDIYFIASEPEIDKLCPDDPNHIDCTHKE